MNPRLVWSDAIAATLGSLPDVVEWTEKKDRFFGPPRREIRTRDLNAGEYAILAHFSAEIRVLKGRLKDLEDALKKHKAERTNGEPNGI